MCAEQSSGHRCLLQAHRGERGRGDWGVSEEQECPQLQAPSTPTEHNSSRVSACATLMCLGDNCGCDNWGRNVCSLRRDTCCTQLLGNFWGIIRRPGKASSHAAYSSFGSLLPPHPDSQLCSPVLGMKSGDSFLYTITLLELLPILSFVSVCFGPDRGPVCLVGQADMQAPWLGPPAARPVANLGVNHLGKPLQTVSSLLEGSPECFCLSWHG